MKGKFSDSSVTKTRVSRQQSMPQEFSSPQKTRSRLPRQQSENNTNGVEMKSGASTAGTDRTSATDTTFSSNSSGNVLPRSPSKSPSKSPTRSPSKRRTRARDVLQLPKPYSLIKSDMVKRWNLHYEKGTSPSEDDEKELQLFKSVEYTHALVLKVNQLSKQVIQLLLDQKLKSVE